MREIEIIDHGAIRNIGDFLGLDIVDWNRYTPYWKTKKEAMNTIAGQIINRYAYKVARVDLYTYPTRNDFPGWQHQGTHEEVGRLYWNHFHYCFNGELRFHDSPDFSGVIRQEASNYIFFGDIGKVSPIAFLQSMHARSTSTQIWITVQDSDTQVILERFSPPTPDIARIDTMVKKLGVFDSIHVMDHHVFQKCRGEIYFVGSVTEVSRMSLHQLRKALSIE